VVVVAVGELLECQFAASKIRKGSKKNQESMQAFSQFYHETVLSFILLLLSCGSAFSQCELKGALTQNINTDVVLKGYVGLEEIGFDSGHTDQHGHFVLHYPSLYQGAGLLEVKNSGKLLLLLRKESIEFTASSLEDLQSLRFKGTQENTFFDRYVKEQSDRELRLSAWKYLKTLYKDSLSDTYNFIVSEIRHLQEAERKFLDSLPPDSYAKYYLPVRKLLQNILFNSVRYPEEIPQIISEFNKLNFSDSRFQSSGIMKQLIGSYYIMLSSYESDATRLVQLYNRTTDRLFDQLSGNNKITIQVSEFLFNEFEKNSMVNAAEYLSLKMLSQNVCKVEGELKNRFEQYRRMAKGMQAPDIRFDKIINGKTSLYEIGSKYKLIVFWASWCEQCQLELPKLEQLFLQLKSRGVEVVTVSLDTNQEEFDKYAKQHILFSYNYCDYKKWNSKPVKDYYVFATPTFYLLNSENKILIKPISAGQIEAILNYTQMLK